MDATSLATGLGLVASVLCGAAAMRASRLMASGLWLAGTSAFLAISLYRLGAPHVAVIELSVGAGLVAVLFVFTITTGGRPHQARSARRAAVVGDWANGARARAAWRGDFPVRSADRRDCGLKLLPRSSGSSAAWPQSDWLCLCSSRR